MIRLLIVPMVWLVSLAFVASAAETDANPFRAEGRLPPQIQTEIDGMRISRTPMPELVREMNGGAIAAIRETDPVAKATARKAHRLAVQAILRESASRAVLRHLYSDSPLSERMTWFWFNHFSVYSQKRDIAPMIADYEDELRTRAFGSFRDLLRMTVTHPAMLRYLDNDLNVAGRINENYARELMELHTLGVDGGYRQADVIQLAHILTGLGVRTDGRSALVPPRLKAYHFQDGLFEFDPRKHDFGEKRLLGENIAGGGMDEVDRALDLLARAPATAAHVSRRIALYFMGTPPPQSLIDRMTAAWRRSDGVIAAVLKAMMDSPEFRAINFRGVKDPVEYVLSAVKLVLPGQPVVDATQVVQWIDWLGEGLYERHTPDGYPLDGAAWTNPGQMAMRFEIAWQISHDRDRLLFGRAGQAKRVDVGAGIAPPIDLGVRTLAAVEAAGSSEEGDMLIFASPEFMRR